MMNFIRIVINNYPGPPSLVSYVHQVFLCGLGESSPIQLQKPHEKETPRKKVLRLHLVRFLYMSSLLRIILTQPVISVRIHLSL